MSTPTFEAAIEFARELIRIPSLPGDEGVFTASSDRPAAAAMIETLEERLGPWPADLSAAGEGGLDPLRERLEQLGYL